MALEHLEVPKDLIDEAVAIVGPLRKVFEEGAKEHAQAKAAADDVAEDKTCDSSSASA